MVLRGTRLDVTLASVNFARQARKLVMSVKQCNKVCLFIYLTCFACLVNGYGYQVPAMLIDTAQEASGILSVLPATEAMKMSKTPLA